MRILLFNPNANPVITEGIRVAALRAATPGTTLLAATSAGGPDYIGSRETIGLAATAAAAELAIYPSGDHDAVILACFGDPGLAALKAAHPQPVVGLVEAAFTQARAEGRKAGIVTGGSAWRDLLPGIVAELGFAGSLHGVAAIERTGGELAGRAHLALDELVEAARGLLDSGADTIVLGGAAFAGLVQPLAARLGAPIIDPIAAAVALAESHASGTAPVPQRRDSA